MKLDTLSKYYSSLCDVGVAPDKIFQVYLYKRQIFNFLRPLS